MHTEFHAMADPTRLEILRRLSLGEMAAGDIAAAFDVTRPAISHHLKVLTEAGLISVRRQAQSRLYSVDTVAVEALRRQFNSFWDAALPRLKAVVEADLRQTMQAKRTMDAHQEGESDA